MASSPSFQPYCPTGGSWYACGNGTKFTGCCDANPCTNVGCSAGNLRPASFRNTTAYGQFPDQECSAGSWYTCTGTNPPFLGCCKSNPCKQNGCPASDLAQGYLSSSPAIANAFDPQPPLPGYGSSSIVPTSTANLAATATAAATNASTSSNISSATSTSSAIVAPADSKSNSVGTIAGAAAGAGVAVILILLALFLVYRRRKRARNEKAHALPSADKSWPTPSTTHYSPYHDDMSKLPAYTSAPNSALLSTTAGSPGFVTPHTSPIPHIYEAGSREITYMPYSAQYSPQQSPTWSSDAGRTDSPSTVRGLGVRVVSGNSEYSRAELGGFTR